jgi:hypothetical protein
VGALTAVGATVLLTNEVASAGLGSDLTFTGERVSFLTDDIIVQRYVELEGQLRTVLAVIKMRGSAHSRDFREYTVTPRGAVIGEAMRAYFGIQTGFPEQRAPVGASDHAGLAGAEAAVLDALVRLGMASLSALETRTGVSRAEVAGAVNRLVALGYAAPAGVGDDGPTYRAVARVSRA